MNDGKSFVVASGALSKQLVADIHGMPKVAAIYIFRGNRSHHEKWAKEWVKIQGVFKSITSICESLKKVAHECEHNAIPMNFVPKRMLTEGATAPGEQIHDQLPSSYMYSIYYLKSSMTRSSALKNEKQLRLARNTSKSRKIINIVRKNTLLSIFHLLLSFIDNTGLL
ncbi:unnamed protein product [Rotaria magnacalcarata]